MQRKKGSILLYQTFDFLLVEATGFEPTTFASRTQRATNCATPRFGFFRKWSNMWSNHLFRDFFIKLYWRNCQVFQGVQRFSKITASRPVAVSRTQRATNCATPRFFKFLSIFVSGQTCGQATYFERFVEKYTARIVRFFKGFSDFQKSLLQDRWRCPERDALPAALRLDLAFHFDWNAYIISNAF